MKLETTADYARLAEELRREKDVTVVMQYDDLTMTVGTRLDQNGCLWVNLVRPYRREWAQVDMRREEVEAMIGAAVTALSVAPSEE